jgi:hypothetical protein
VSFQPAVPLPGIAGWRLLERTQARQQAAFEQGPELQRDVAWFAERNGRDIAHDAARRPRSRASRGRRPRSALSVW